LLGTLLPFFLVGGDASCSTLKERGLQSLMTKLDSSDELLEKNGSGGEKN